MTLLSMVVESLSEFSLINGRSVRELPADLTDDSARDRGFGAVRGREGGFSGVGGCVDETQGNLIRKDVDEKMSSILTFTYWLKVNQMNPYSLEYLWHSNWLNHSMPYDHFLQVL